MQGDNPSFALRAFHPETVRRAGGALAVDFDWYLAQQVLPPVTRLCAVIQGTFLRIVFFVEGMAVRNSGIACLNNSVITTSAGVGDFDWHWCNKPCRR